MGAWAQASRGKGLSYAHNEAQPIRMALFSWAQEPPYGPVPWHLAVLRCIKAAQANGTKFGDSPKYAIRVVNGLLAAWRNGHEPETPASSPNGTAPKPVPKIAYGVTT